MLGSGWGEPLECHGPLPLTHAGTHMVDSLKISQDMHLAFISFSVCASDFMTLKSFRNILAEFDPRLREKAVLVKGKKMKINLYQRSYKIQW